MYKFFTIEVKKKNLHDEKVIFFYSNFYENSFVVQENLQIITIICLQFYMKNNIS